MTPSTLVLSLLGGIGTAYGYRFAGGFRALATMWIILGASLLATHAKLLHPPTFCLAFLVSWMVNVIIVYRRTL